MPKYDYYCEANRETVEVNHPMSASLNTWGELCAHAGAEPGDTPAEAPVRKLLSGSFVSTGSSSAVAPAHSCETPTCCGGGACPLD